MARQTTFGTVVGAGREVTHGTEVARTTWRRVESITIERAAEHAGAGTFQGNALAAAHFDEVVQLREATKGMIRMPLDYHGMGLWLEAAFGAVADAGSGPSSYTHTYTHTRALPPGLTLEIGRGNALTEEVYGAMASKASLEVAANGVGSLELEIIAKTGQTRASVSSPTHVTSYRVVGHHVGVVTFNAVTYTPTRVKLVIDNGLASVDECGSLYTAPPERGAPFKVTFELEFYANSTVGDALYNAHLAKTASNLTVTMTHPTEGYTIAITLHGAICHTCTTPLTGGGGGLIKTSASFQGYASGTDYGCAIVITNGQSSGIV